MRTRGPLSRTPACPDCGREKAVNLSFCPCGHQFPENCPAAAWEPRRQVVVHLTESQARLARSLGIQPKQYASAIYEEQKRAALAQYVAHLEEQRKAAQNATKSSETPQKAKHAVAPQPQKANPPKPAQIHPDPPKPATIHPDPPEPPKTPATPETKPKAVPAPARPDPVLFACFETPRNRAAVRLANMQAEARFLDQQNDRAHRHFLKILDEIPETCLEPTDIYGWKNPGRRHYKYEQEARRRRDGDGLAMKRFHGGLIDDAVAIIEGEMEL